MNRTKLDLSYNSDIRNVNGVQFGIKSAEQIEQEAVAEIFTHETFSGDVPKHGGLFDPLMGVLDRGVHCPTDENDMKNCPGYFGFIRLAHPVYHYHLISPIIATLKVCCLKCSHLYVDINNPKIREKLKSLKGSKRFEYITRISDKIKKCRMPMCGYIRPDNITKHESNDLSKLTAEWKVKAKGSEKKKKIQILRIRDVQTVFKRLSRNTPEVEALGYSHLWCLPDRFVCTNLPVIPPVARPSVKADNNTRSEDDITHKYVTILKVNRTLRQKLESDNVSEDMIDGWVSALQYNVATLVDNKISGVPFSQQRSGRPIKALKERLKSKEGRVRGNLMGKRVDFSARSVITPDPNIGIGELGVPIKICMNLTKPITVNRYNIDNLTKYVRNGADVYPGAKSVTLKSTGRTKHLNGLNSKEINLQYGDVVLRHLMEGDYVLFNRQPSLHKMSMQCHRVRPLDGNTFRLNLSVTGPYNADFDGDEMNMHVPQSYQSEVEIMVLAAVPNQIVGPGQNRPVIGLVQDSIIGSALMTAYNNFLTANDIKNLLIWVREYKDEFANMDGDWNTPPYFTKGTPLEEVILDSPEFHWFHEAVDRNTWTLREDLWTGRQLVSLIIPNIYLEKNNMLKDLPESARDRGKVVIRDGEYDQGVMDKNILGSKSQGLVHVIFNDLGSEKAEEFLDDMQNIVTNWLVTHGFSVGISDLIANDVAKESMGKVLAEKQRKVTELIQEVHRGKLKNDSGKPDSIEFELQVNKHLNAAVSDAGKIGIRELPSSNRMTSLINSGSKGSVLNMGQMIACLGQQNIDGRRIKNGFKDRTLPFFLKYDDGPASKGFVASSFIKGLKPHELFHHAQGGREGLIDTAVKTSKTGYIQRKLVKSMEECAIQADSTVRDANGNIIQFLYGEDGVDPTKVEKQSLRTICMNHEELTAKYRFNAVDMFDEYLTQDVIDKITMEVPGSKHRVLKPEVREKLDEHFNQLLDDKEFIIEEIHHNHPSVEVYYPINMDRLIKNVKNKYARNTVKSDLNPLEILQQLNEFEKSLFVTRMNPGNYLLSILLRQKLSPKILIKQMHFTREAFQELAQVIYTKFQGALAEAGESVGTVAAQSIGEPATQMTLNSVDYNTKVTVMDGRRAKTVKIGKLIDEVLSKHDADIVKYPENRTDYLETNENENIYIPACDRSGNMGWYKVDAVTRHLPIGELVKVTTETGRELIATQGHSFLVWDNNRLIEKEGRELKKGEYLPTIVNYPELPFVTENLNLCDYLPKKEYLYGSDFNQIKELYIADKRKKKVGFWKKHLNKTVTLPYNRPDSIIDVIKGKKLVTTEILPGIVYPKKCNRVVSRIPENFPLDREFGFICGIYLAEGWTTNTFMGISNNEEIVLNKVRQWCDDMNVTHHTVVSTNKRFEGSTSTDLKIHSVVLARLFKEVMNTGSCDKHIPSEAISGNMEFVLGILDGYFTGDGTVNKNDGSISCSSVSKELIYGISQLCSRIGVFGRINSIQVKRNNVGSQNIKRIYYFNIRNGYAQKFGEIVGFTHPEKQHRITEITLKKKYRSKTGKYKQTNDMMYDKISNIEYVEGSEFVYDFTINDVHTFCMTDGLAGKNTFHFAGIGSKSQVVRGVPRLEELMSATKDIKTPALTVYLKPEIAKNKDMSSQVVNSIEITTVRAIVTSTKIYSDQVPKNNSQDTDTPSEEDDSDDSQSYSLQLGGNTSDEGGGGGAKEESDSDDVTEEDFDEFGIDDDLMEIYNEFQEYVFDEDVETSPIILRFKFDRKEMLDKDLKMEDVYNAIDTYFNTVDSQSIRCTYSDDNSASLIFRIQLIGNKDAGDVDDVHRKLSTIEKQILDIPLKGLKGIKKASMYKEENTYRKINGQYVKSPEWVVNTDGSNLSEVLAIDAVDNTKTYSNDLLEIYRIFGVEAARELLIREINDVVESSGAYVNYRHVSLLADAMTNRGGIMPITRHGINKSDRGPLAKCSFEETSDVLIKAAVFGELDNMKGVSANIMFGQEVKVGTGAVELIYDEEFMLQDGEGIEDGELQTEEFLDTYCNDERLTFNMEDVHKIKKEATEKPADHITIPTIELSDDDSDSD